MKCGLDISSVGTVTSIGLDALQAAAAFRARLAGFKRDIPLEPPQEALRAAPIPAHNSLRRDENSWLLNMAARAIRECLNIPSSFRRIGLLMALPEAERKHPAMESTNAEQFVSKIRSSVPEIYFASASCCGEGGAAIATGLTIAEELMLQGSVDACVLGGLDSLVNRIDTDRLRKARRMLEPENPKGLIPGEGAAVLLVTLPNSHPGALAKLHGSDSATEQFPVTGRRMSQGRGFEQALRGAIADSRMPESAVSFRVSTMNGEHYAVWESMFYATRTYRTRRESFPVWYTASSVGEMGAASGAFAVILAALGIKGGYAPGCYAMCESASETGLRGACLVGPALGSPLPPFRPEEGASSYILRRHQSPK